MTIEENQVDFFFLLKRIEGEMKTKNKDDWDSKRFFLDVLKDMFEFAFYMCKYDPNDMPKTNSEQIKFNQRLDEKLRSI